jgi:hypothetical protein
LLSYKKYLPKWAYFTIFTSFTPNPNPWTDLTISIPYFSIACFLSSDLPCACQSICSYFMDNDLLIVFCHCQLDGMLHPSHVSQKSTYQWAVLKTRVWSSSLPEKIIDDLGRIHSENEKNCIYNCTIDNKKKRPSWEVQLILYLLAWGTRHFLPSHPDLNRNINS